MIVTFSFEIRNFVEVIEDWPIQKDDVIFAIKRDGDIAKRVVISYTGIDIKYAPTISVNEFDSRTKSINLNIAKHKELAISPDFELADGSKWPPGI